MKKARKRLVESEKTAAVYQFIYHVAHNLNTPLGNAITATSLNNKFFNDIKESLNSPEPSRKAMFDKIDKLFEINGIVTNSLDKATSLINKLQSLTTISTVELESCNIKSNISLFIEQKKQLLLDNNIDIDIDIGSDINCSIPHSCLYELLDIFLDNTIKHVKKDIVKVFIRVTYDEKLKLTYQDNGISPDFKQLAFDAIYNEQYSLNSQFLEQGIGLVKAHFISVKQGIDLSLNVGEYGGILYTLDFPKSE